MKNIIRGGNFKMSQSLSFIFIHLVFSTKKRIQLINNKIKPEIQAYMSTILRNHDSPAIIVRAMDEHVHALFNLSRRYSVSKIVEEVKKSSSKWVKTKGGILTKFQWQNGYGAFSVSQSCIDAVRNYIANQNIHHRRMSFEDELRILLKKHRIDYNEKYLWD